MGVDSRVGGGLAWRREGGAGGADRNVSCLLVADHYNSAVRIGQLPEGAVLGVSTN